MSTKALKVNDIPPDISMSTLKERIPSLNLTKGNRTSITLKRPLYKVFANPKKNLRLKKGVEKTIKDGVIDMLNPCSSA